MKRSKENLKEMESYSTLLMQMMLLVFIAYFIAIHACICFIIAGFSTGGFTGDWTAAFMALFGNWMLIRFTVGIPLLAHVAIAVRSYRSEVNELNQLSDDDILRIHESCQRGQPMGENEKLTQLSPSIEIPFLRTVYVETVRMCRDARIKTPEMYVSQWHQLNAYTADLPHGRHAVVLWCGLVAASRSPKFTAAIVAHELGHIISKDCTHHALMDCGIKSMLKMWSEGKSLVDKLSYNSLHPADDKSPTFDKWVWGVTTGVLGRFMMLAGCIGCLFGNIVYLLHRRQAEFIADSRGAALLDDEQVLAEAMIVLEYASLPRRDKGAQAKFSSIAKFSPDEIMRGVDEHPDMLHRIRKIRPSFDGDYESAFKKIIRKYSC